MSRASQRLLKVLAANLSPEERESVCGDLREMRYGLLGSLREITGLLIRQEIQTWLRWQSWLGIIGIVAFLLIPARKLGQLAVMAPMQYIGVYLKYEVLYQSGLSFELEAIQWLCQIVALGLFSWSAGMAFRRIVPTGPRLRLLALWAIGIGLITFQIHRHGAPFWVSIVPILIFSAPLFLPMLWGASNRLSLSRTGSIALLAASAGAVALLTWTSGWWQASIVEMNGGFRPALIPWYARSWPWLLAALPAAYISLTDFRRERGTA